MDAWIKTVDGEEIPEADHISRYVPYSKLVSDGTKVSGAAFQLRENEDYLSVNWLEYFGFNDRILEISEVRKAFVAKGYSLRRTAKFAVLAVGELKLYIEQETNGKTKLQVIHKPIQPEDPSHSGIFGVPADEPIISDLMAELVNDDSLFPAVSSSE